jgi:hypothetical protein
VRDVVCKTAEPGSIPGRLSNLSRPRGRTERRLSSKQFMSGFDSRRGPSRSSVVHRSIVLSPSASWPRLLVSHSGNAGSNPAGDAGPFLRPVRPINVRLGARAHQPRSRSGARARRTISPCPGGQAPCYERGHRGSTPRRETTTCRLCSGGTRRKPPKLAGRVRLPAEAPQGCANDQRPGS